MLVFFKSKLWPRKPLTHSCYKPVANAMKPIIGLCWESSLRSRRSPRRSGAATREEPLWSTRVINVYTIFYKQIMLDNCVVYRSPHTTWQHDLHVESPASWRWAGHVYRFNRLQWRLRSHQHPKDWISIISGEAKSMSMSNSMMESSLVFALCQISLRGCGSRISCFRHCRTNPTCAPEDSEFMVSMTLDKDSNEPEINFRIGGYLTNNATVCHIF